MAPLPNPSSDLSSFFTRWKHTTYYLFKDHIRSFSSNPKHPGMEEWAYISLEADKGKSDRHALNPAVSPGPVPSLLPCWEMNMKVYPAVAQVTQPRSFCLFFFFAGLAHGHFNTQTNMGYSEGRVEAVRGREEGQVWSSPGQTRF